MIDSQVMSIGEHHHTDILLATVYNEIELTKKASNYFLEKKVNLKYSLLLPSSSQKTQKQIYSFVKYRKKQMRLFVRVTGTRVANSCRPSSKPGIWPRGLKAIYQP